MILLHYLFDAVNHLDYLGVQIAWVSGPWFLSLFMNMLPWESGQFLFVFIFINQQQNQNIKTYKILLPVLRVWDVLLFQGNRVMLFRTALSLMELYGTVFPFFDLYL